MRLIKRLPFIAILFSVVLCSKAQNPVMYSANKKWGYTVNDVVIIKAQYDTAFAFDKSGSIAMVGNKNPLRMVINPLTGEEAATIDYYFITKNNTRLKLKDSPQSDSVSVFPDQQELKLNYINNLNLFKIVYNNKDGYFIKNGKQLSEGFDDIFQSGLNRFYITETYTEWDHEIVRSKGLIDTTGKTIVKCEKKHIRIIPKTALFIAVAPFLIKNSVMKCWITKATSYTKTSIT